MLGWDFFWKSPSWKHTPLQSFLHLPPVGLEGREKPSCTQNLASGVPGSLGAPEWQKEHGMEHRVGDSHAFGAWQVWSKGMKS